MPCCATPCPHGGRSREGRAVPCWAVGNGAGGRERCKHWEGTRASLPTDTLDIQTRQRVDKPFIVFCFPQCCLGKHSPAISEALGDLIERDGLLPCPEWLVTPTSDSHCPLSVKKSGISCSWGSYFMCLFLAVLKYNVVYSLI